MSEPNELKPREELLPCPFCAGTPLLKDLPTRWEAHCICRTSMWRETHYSLVKAWNRRAYLATTAPPPTHTTCPDCNGRGVFDPDGNGHEHCETCSTTGRIRVVAKPAPSALPPEMEDRIPHAPSCRICSPDMDCAAVAEKDCEFEESHCRTHSPSPRVCNCFRAGLLDTIRTLQAHLTQVSEELAISKHQATYWNENCVQSWRDRDIADIHSGIDRVELKTVCAELSRLRAEQLELTNDRDYRLAQKDAEVVRLRVENERLRKALTEAREQYEGVEDMAPEMIPMLDRIDAALNAGEVPREPSDSLPAAAVSRPPCESKGRA